MIFLIIPMVEIGLFIGIGGEIGVVATLLLTFLTALIGALLVRTQGFGVLRRMQQRPSSSNEITSMIFDGLCIGVAGLLLITPGFFTDTVGFLLLVPWVRQFLFSHVSVRLNAAARQHEAQTGPGRTEDVTITAEYEDITNQGPMPPPRGKWDSNA